jgi:hypothetical protein
MKNQQLAKKLITLHEADFILCQKLIDAKTLSDGYHPEMATLHNQNAVALQEIIDQIGFPTVDKVGKQAADAAFTIVQHAIEQPLFMNNCLQLLQNIKNPILQVQLQMAFLSDRIAIFQNKAQQFGTQFDWDETGKMCPNTIDDLRQVNIRRNNIGLNSIEEQTLLMQNRVVAENQKPPTDFQDRKTKFELWKKKVGWI